MQQTRREIIEILHERGEATVDELVEALKARINHDITAVTVRHHLDVLRSEELVTPPEIRRRNTPGRPQHVYALSERALTEQFPNNYQNLAANLLTQIKTMLPPSDVNVIMERTADQMVADAGVLDMPLEARLDQVVSYLNQHGYDAQWEPCTDGYLLSTCNCPYRQIADGHEELCGLDSRLVAGLVGIVPRRLGRIVENDDSCTYLIPVRQAESST